MGKLGYTCMGITPGVGWANTDAFPKCLPYNGPAADFVKYCYDKDRDYFKEGAGRIYKDKYMIGVCDQLPDPAFYVCSDISVNSGPDRVREFLEKLGKPGRNIKAYARELNNMDRAFYKSIASKNPKFEEFLKGWLKRADKRDEFINHYNC